MKLNQTNGFSENFRKKTRFVLAPIEGKILFLFAKKEKDWNESGTDFDEHENFVAPNN